jgi:hypothetical protein
VTAPAVPHRPRRRWLLPALLAALAYLGGALWVERCVLSDPSRLVAVPAEFRGKTWRKIYLADETLVAATIAENAQALVTRPLHLFDNGHCYPFPKPVTLGEHMFGDGLLGIVPYWLTREPVVVFNVVVIAVLFLAGVTMYALVYHFTQSAGAAFVAGLLFALQPDRQIDPAHPFILGNHWMPLGLLFAHRLVAGGRWRDAVGLGLAIGLQALESFYLLIVFALVGGIYGTTLLLGHARRVPRLLPKVLAVGVAVGALLVALLRPYLHTRAVWGLLQGRDVLLVLPQDFGPGHYAFPGVVLLVLATIGLAGRALGPRRRLGDDPRLPLLIAGLLCFWGSVWFIHFPLVDVWVPSLWALARGIPGLDAVRGGGNVRLGTYLALTVLAGYGAAAVLARFRSARWRVVVTTALAGLIACELLYPPARFRSFGRDLVLEPQDVRPPEPLVRLVAKAEDGAFLDLPFDFAPIMFTGPMSDYLLLGAYHGRPVAACYNSFGSRLQAEVAALVARLPDYRAADDLHALGFRTILVRDDLAFELRRGSTTMMTRMLVQRSDEHAYLIDHGRVPGFALYRIATPLPLDTSRQTLAMSADPGDAIDLPPGPALVPFEFRNRTRWRYRQPDPLEPTSLVIRWAAAWGAVVADERVTTLLPVALAPGESITRPLLVTVPRAPGEYRVTVAPATTPDLAVASRRVRVLAPALPPEMEASQAPRAG